MFDQKAIKSSFSRAASEYEARAELQKKIREDALELAREYFSTSLSYQRRLVSNNNKDWMPAYAGMTKPVILDLGCGTAMLPEGWEVINVDIAYGMCAVASRRGAMVINASAEALPLPNASVDGVFSSLMLQWVSKPEAVIVEILRVLKPEGVAIITTFVQGTLKELAEAFLAIDDAPHISEFITAEQLLLRAAHAGAVVLEIHDETYEEEIKNPLTLMKSIKNIGASNKRTERKKGMMTRAQLAKVEETYTGNIASWQVLTMVLTKN